VLPPKHDPSSIWEKHDHDGLVDVHLVW